MSSRAEAHVPHERRKPPWSAITSTGSFRCRGTKTKDKIDIDVAARILDEDHYGLEKPKERILEYLAVQALVKKIKGPILCFVGPGRGKRPRWPDP